MTRLIYSHGGYAREFAKHLRAADPLDEIIFVDDMPSDGAIGYEDALIKYGPDKAQIIVAFAGAALRRSKTKQVLRDGYSLYSVQAETAQVGPNVEIGEGSILSDFSTITADASIGRSFQCNIYSYVAHDCKIADFVTLAPRASVNGRVEIADDVYVGTGATILPGQPNAPIRIGAGAVIGAHALVTRDVPAGSTVVGAPARILEKKDI